jgi:MFS transporter, OFA family, oxalate/formate antiporter
MTGEPGGGLLPQLLARRLPFFYGWVILACTCCAGFSRQGGAVGTLSIFVEPMTREFGWTRTALSGAVSLGGVLAALSAPLHGRVLDRRGARFLLCAAVLSTGAAAMLLSLTNSLLMFYLLFCVARMNFAAPFDLGIYGAVNNWFVTRRPLVSSIATLAQMAGLVVLPIIAQLGILRGGWRVGWLAVGTAVLAVGFIPNWLFMVRRPEDLGLLPDAGQTRPTPGSPATVRLLEPRFTRAQAIRTPAFWLLCLFTVFAFPVQAGASLHQAPYLIERGINPTIAATIVGTFSFMSGVSSLAFGAVARAMPLRYGLSLAGALECAAMVAMLRITTPADGYLAAAIFGAGVGGLMTLLPIAWADYFGRRSYGAIRGMALSVQVLGQACGPLLSGALRDQTGSYGLSLKSFAVLAALSALTVLWARHPAYGTA